MRSSVFSSSSSSSRRCRPPPLPLSCPGRLEFDTPVARDAAAEMEKRADGADASVLFLLLGCANLLDVYAQIRLNTVLIAEC